MIAGVDPPANDDPVAEDDPVLTHDLPRVGCCSVAGNSRQWKPLQAGTFLDLELGQNRTDSAYTGAVVAVFVEGVGATCEPPLGYSFDGVTFVDGQGKATGLQNAVYPLFTKQPPHVDPLPQGATRIDGHATPSGPDATDHPHLRKE